MHQGDSERIVLEIVSALEESGLPRYSYSLNDSVDVDALTQLVSTGDPNLVVTFTVQDYQITVTGDNSIKIDQADT